MRQTWYYLCGTALAAEMVCPWGYSLPGNTILLGLAMSKLWLGESVPPSTAWLSSAPGLLAFALHLSSSRWLGPAPTNMIQTELQQLWHGLSILASRWNTTRLISMLQSFVWKLGYAAIWSPYAWLVRNIYQRWDCKVTLALQRMLVPYTRSVRKQQGEQTPSAWGQILSMWRVSNSRNAMALDIQRASLLVRILSEIGFLAITKGKHF